MRTLDATLLAAMETGNYDPYFLATIQDNLNGNVYLAAQPTGYELSDLELTLTVQMPVFMTSIVLTRGVTIAGLHYTLSTSKFVIINSTWDGNFQTFKCHLIPRVHYSAAGDLTYKQIIDAFCATFGKTAVYLDAGAAWLNYQFLPTGKMLILNNAQTLFQQLKQKYFIFACDNGSDQILFYTAFSHVASPQYQVTGYRFAVDYNVDQRRQYIWRDENETLHKTTPSFAFAAQPDATVQAIMSLLDLGTGVVLAGTAKNAVHGGKIYRSTDYGLTWDAGFDLNVINGNYVSVFSLLNLGNGIILAAGYYGGFVLRSTDYGVTWTEVQTIGVDSTNCLTNCDNGIVLMSHIGGGTVQVWKSIDYGLTWAQAAVLGTETSLYAISYLGAGVCLAGTGPAGKVYRSTDYGSSWGLIQQLGTEHGVISLLGLGSGLVLAGTWHNDTTGCKIYKSIDAGLSWSYVTGLGEEYVYTLNTLGGGVVIAGTGRNGKIFRSVDFSAHWDLVQALGSEKFVYSFLTLGNGSTLAGTGDNANIWKSLNCAADLDIIHNLGFLPSTAVEPTAYYLLAQPKFDPFPVHLKYQSSDYIRINLLQGGTYDFTCAEVTEVLDLKQKAMPYRMLISQTEWLSNTAVGPLPGTIERVGSYTPLVTAAFDDILSENDNNVQAAMDTLDNHTHGPQLVGKTEKAAPDDADLFSLVDSLTSTHLVRKITWADIKAHTGGITEAPIDGTLYGRQDGSWQHAASSGREKLTAPRYYYVRTDGSDSNDGSANNSWSAFATLGHALAVCGSLDFNLQTVNIYIADGTYTSQAIIPNLFGGGTLCVIGNQGTPSNVLLSVANNSPIYCNASIIGVNLMFSYFKIQASGSAYALIQHIGIGAIHLSHMNFGTSPGHQLYAEGSGAMIVCTSDAYTISGGGSTHWYTELQATISVTATTVTLSGTPAFSVAFAKASHLSLENLGGNTYSGSATGKRYDAQHNSVIASGVTLPGNASGTTATQGIYL